MGIAKYYYNEITIHRRSSLRGEAADALAILKRAHEKWAAEFVPEPEPKATRACPNPVCNTGMDEIIPAQHWICSRCKSEIIRQ